MGFGTVLGSAFPEWGQWGTTRFNYSGNNVDYIGRHTDHDAATTDKAWVIRKLIYSGNDLVRIEGPLMGAWDDRAALGWTT